MECVFQIRAIVLNSYSNSAHVYYFCCPLSYLLLCEFIFSMKQMMNIRKLLFMNFRRKKLFLTLK